MALTVDIDDYWTFFRFPPDTAFYPALTEVLQDPTHFPEPEKFKPERFLEISPETGKLVYKPNHALIPFGVGKRECLGKTLAKMELFLFVTCLLHQFSFEAPENHPLVNPEESVIGATRAPAPFYTKITPRN